MLWLLTPNQSAHKLIDSSFRPVFYVHVEESASWRLAHLLTSQFRVECNQVERIDIWQAKSLSVLEVAVCNPLCFRPVVNLV